MADLKTKIVIDAEDKASGAVGKVADEVKQLDQAAAKAAPAVDRLGDELDDVSSGAAPALEQTAEAMADTAREADKAADAVGRVGGMEPQIKKLAGAMAGLFAAGKLAGYARDAIATADAYNLLEARMRLAVGPAGDLGAAMERVTQTSNESGAALSSSAELYGRIAQSTTDLGYSQERVADLTDTITKSFVVSGTSAQETSGAITQLAQAFAAGALRGDEFNSVNEAAPELMAALARGLGVARGELRGLAEDGELTTERVLKALESQRDAISTSFEQLPKTVGGAMQELANNWQIFLSELNNFLGELNNSTGATEKLAGMISTLANNLDTVASLATLAGEALLGLAAARALTAIHGVTAALGAAAGNAGLLATAANTAAAALARLAPMLKVAGASVAAFEVAKAWWDIGDAILRTRELAEEYEQSQQSLSASQDALSARLQAVSQSTGVAVTSMADLNAAIAAGKIHFDELTASWQAGVAPLTETEAAMQRLGPRVFELVGQFDALREAGKSVGESLAGVFDGLDVSGIASLHMAIQAFDELRATGKASAAEVGEAWSAALEKVSGQQLAQMAENLRLAGAESEQLAQINDAVLAESYRRLGITAEAAMGGISKKSADAVAALDAIARSSGATEAGLVAAAMAAYSMADSADAIKAVDARVQEWAKSSRIAEQGVTALGEASKKANDAMGDFGSKPATGLQKLGLTADEARQQIATLEKEYAAMMAAGDTQGAAGKQAEIFKLRDAFKGAGDAAAEAGGKSEQAGNIIQAAGDRYAKAGESAQEAAKHTETYGEALNDTASVAQWFASVIGALKEDIASYSATARESIDAAWEQGESLDQVARSISGMAASARELVAADLGYSQLTGEIAQVKEEAAAARAQVEQLEYAAHFSGGFSGVWSYIQSLSEMKAALAEAKAAQLEFDLSVEQFYDRVDDGSLNLEQQADMLRRLSAEAEYYGSQNLDSLRSALADVQSRMQSIEDSSRSTLASLNDELDRMNGNLVAIEKRRAAQQRDDIRGQLDEARGAGNAEAVANLNAALAKLNEVEALRVQEAKARMQAERERAEEDRKRRAQESSGRPGPGGDSGGGTVNINLPPNGAMGYSAQDLDRFARQLAPTLKDLQRKGAL